MCCGTHITYMNQTEKNWFMRGNPIKLNLNFSHNLTALPSTIMVRIPSSEKRTTIRQYQQSFSDLWTGLQLQRRWWEHLLERRTAFAWWNAACRSVCSEWRTCELQRRDAADPSLAQNLPQRHTHSSTTDANKSSCRRLHRRRVCACYTVRNIIGKSCFIPLSSWNFQHRVDNMFGIMTGLMAMFFVASTWIKMLCLKRICAWQQVNISRHLMLTSFYYWRSCSSSGPLQEFKKNYYMLFVKVVLMSMEIWELSLYKHADCRHESKIHRCKSMSPHSVEAVTSVWNLWDSVYFCGLWHFNDCDGITITLASSPHCHGTPGRLTNVAGQHHLYDQHFCLLIVAWRKWS